MINASPLQLDIFKCIKETNKNILVRAAAGSGKTTTIVEASKLLPRDSSSIFLAFNRHIKDELSGRLPSNIQCNTIHSLGLTTLIKHYHIHFKLNEVL